MHDKPDDICSGEHPNPLTLTFIPHQQLLNVVGDKDVDGGPQCLGLVYR